MNHESKGFTLIELLVVIGIIAILATITVVVLNPAQLFAQSRDAQRLSDMTNLTSAINYANFAGHVIGNNNNLSLSIPAVQANCTDLSGLPTLVGGWFYYCVTSTEYLKIDGAGWVPADLSDPFAINDTAKEWAEYLASVGPTTYSTTGAVIKKLPVDPINTVTGGYYMYLVNGSNFEFVAKFESTKYQARATTDGGYDSTRYEVGSDLTLWKTADGL